MFLLERKNLNGSLNTIHFVGIGGIGMSGIAQIMHNLGYKVQGSDNTVNNNTKRLEELGIKVLYSHNKDNIDNVSYVVISSAIKKDNPEVQQALLLKVPVIRRAEMLAELMRLKCSIAVSGSHGKTTTTSLIANLLEVAGLNPTVINGGIINNRSTNAYLGSDNYLVAEADESDATFIQLPATIAVITNIDKEHIDFYGSFDNLLESFRKFITHLPFYGFAACCIDDPVLRNLISTITERKIITYGIDSDDANIKAYDVNLSVTSSTFSVKITLPHLSATTVLENITISIPGRHNILNSLAAIAVGIELDFGLKVIQDGFRNFHGVKRRFTKICDVNGVSIIDDYAHHPSEVQATMQTAKTIADKQNGRVIAIFQPHRYTRLKLLFNEFIDCFDLADEVYITDLYSAGEEYIEGYSSLDLIKAMNAKNNTKLVKFIEDHNDIASIIKKTTKSGDIVVMMGAGSISSWANDLKDKL